MPSTLNERPPEQSKPRNTTPRRDKLSTTNMSSRVNSTLGGTAKPGKILSPTSPTSPPGRSQKTVYPGERELLQAARQYQDREKEKQVKWFTARGHPIPTEEQVSDLEARKEAELAKEAALRRQEDRNRKQTEVGHVATVACSAHPLYMDEETKANRTKADEPKFGVVAATGIGGRQLLQNRFSTACFTALLRLRAEQRLNKALQARATAQQTSQSALKTGTNGTNKSGLGILDLNLTLMVLPSALPTGDGSTTALPTGGSSNSAQGSAAQGAAQQVAHEFPEDPSSTKVELFHAKPMQKPLEFKRKDYHQVKLSEHPYNNADLPEPVANLPAGLLEAPEAKAGQDGNIIGTMVQFQQPIVTLETYKAVPFAFSKKDPQSHLILGVEAQPVTDGGFLKPHDDVDHGQGVPSLNEDGDFAGTALLREKLPSKMKFKSNDDDLSDTDDDEGTELPRTHPKSLLVDIGDWLPAFSGTHGAAGSSSPQEPTSAEATSAPAGASVRKGGDGKAAAGGKAQQSATTAPATASEEDGKKKQQQHLDALNTTWLGWAQQPMHAMGLRTSNEAFLQRRAQAQDYVHNEALGTVPSALKKIL